VWAVSTVQNTIGGTVTISSNLEAVISAKVFGHTLYYTGEDQADPLGEIVFDEDTTDMDVQQWSNLQFNFAKKNQDIVIVIEIENLSQNKEINVTIATDEVEKDSNMTCVVSKENGGDAVERDVIPQATEEESATAKYYINLHIVDTNHSVESVKFSVVFTLECVVIEP
jgi:hypothetical protein